MQSFKFVSLVLTSQWRHKVLNFGLLQQFLVYRVNQGHTVSSCKLFWGVQHCLVNNCAKFQIYFISGSVRINRKARYMSRKCKKCPFRVIFNHVTWPNDVTVSILLFIPHNLHTINLFGAKLQVPISFHCWVINNSKCSQALQKLCKNGISASAVSVPFLQFLAFFSASEREYLLSKLDWFNSNAEFAKNAACVRH